MFVADPSCAPPESDILYVRPDDCDDNGISWRDHLVRYNLDSTNRFGLSEAFKLYENPTYRKLALKVGLDNLLILSAGWGLISSRFHTPQYDISFSNQAAPYVRRKEKDLYRDFELPRDTKGPIIFLGGRSYLSLFCRLTKAAAQRTVFYNSAIPPLAPGCELRRFETPTRTNWHYECAKALIDGQLPI